MTHFVCAGGLYQSSKYLWRFKGPHLIFLFCLIDFFSSSNSLNLSSIRPLKSTSSLDSASLGEKSLHSDLKFGHLSDEISGRIPPKTDIGLQHTGKKNSWPTLNFDHLSEDTLKLRWSPKKLRNQNIQEPLKSKRLLPRTLEALKSFWKNLLEKLKKKITKGLANHEIYEKDLDYNSFPHELNEWTEIKLLKPKIIKQQQKALQSDEKVSVQVKKANHWSEVKAI
ncbi:hypothetical protein BY996DRAFT_4042702 [Phakopsora pachyrhizi]|nr:hypothetical protein BY996DRAFT_4042702 [Phakopsora pachyrhizi]